MSIKVISLNIERSKHTAVQETFYKKVLDEAGPVVLCLQEVMHDHFCTLLEELDIEGVFYPTMYHSGKETGDKKKLEGIAVFSTLGFQFTAAHYFRRSSRAIPHYKDSEENRFYVNSYKNTPMVVVQVEENSKVYTIATTHYTWGMASEYHPANDDQLYDAALVVDILKRYNDVILTGDYNSERFSGDGEKGKVYKVIQEGLNLKDAVSAEIRSTLDSNLFRLYDKLILQEKLRIDPDWVLVSNAYKVHKAELVEGLSDHQAVIIDVSKK